MDPYFQKQIYKSPYVSQLSIPRLTSYQAASSFTNPGTGSSNMTFTPMTPLYGETLYSNQKETKGSKVGGLQNEVVVSNSDPKDTINTQKGLGAVEMEEKDNESDMDTSGLQKMNENVLKAFETPIIKTNTFQFEPKKRKLLNTETNDEPSKIKKKLKGKLKFV